VKIVVPGSAWWGHALVLGGLVVSLGVTRLAWLEPRDRERRALEAQEHRLRTEVADLQSGIQDMDAWVRANRGGDGMQGRIKRVAPAGTMVTSLLDALATISAAHGVRTELIQPAGVPTDEAVTDASGAPVTYRKAEIRFRIEAPYREIGAYLADVESLDQLVIVRAVALRHEATLAPALVADVSLWVYGTP
jgi:Tfp pilus assembly protein PilO